ncbi:MAG: group III truncated hemoglobin [Chitinophagales bacterium]
MSDISNREDLVLLVQGFYEKVRADETLGFIFTDVARVEWETHLPKMYDFWEANLFGKTTYRGNPMQAHILLSRKTTLSSKQFNQWLLLWCSTVDAHFVGPVAEEAKRKGQQIAQLMQFKIQQIGGA